MGYWAARGAGRRDGGIVSAFVSLELEWSILSIEGGEICPPNVNCVFR